VVCAPKDAKPNCFCNTNICFLRPRAGAVSVSLYTMRDECSEKICTPYAHWSYQTRLLSCTEFGSWVFVLIKTSFWLT